MIISKSQLQRLERTIRTDDYQIIISRRLVTVKIRRKGRIVVSCQGDGATKVINTAIATWKANYAT